MLTKDQITQDALLILRAGGARVRKVHNVSAYKKRRGQVEKGVGDIEGYTSKAIFIMCEVKTIGDRLRLEQIKRLEDIVNCGGFAYIATEERGETILKTFKEYIK
jgi:hypothetical protein